jgi:hypothetical protein
LSREEEEEEVAVVVEEEGSGVVDEDEDEDDEKEPGSLRDGLGGRPVGAAGLGGRAGRPRVGRGSSDLGGIWRRGEGRFGFLDGFVGGMNAMARSQ